MKFPDSSLDGVTHASRAFGNTDLDFVSFPREIIRELIASEGFKSTGDVVEALKSVFAEVLGEVLEAELDTTLGYDKQERRPAEGIGSKPKNYRNGHTTQTVKTQLGEVEISVPRDRNGEYEPQIIGKCSRNADGMEDKILSLYAADVQPNQRAAYNKNSNEISKICLSFRSPNQVLEKYLRAV